MQDRKKMTATVAFLIAGCHTIPVVSRMRSLMEILLGEEESKYRQQ
jgi:hypothetical protein